MCATLGWGWIVLFVVGGNVFHYWWNPLPARYARYGRPWITPFNLLSEKKWTPEGVEHNRRRLVFLGMALPVFLLGMGLVGLFCGLIS